MVPIILGLPLLGGLAPRAATAQPPAGQAFGIASESVQVVVASEFTSELSSSSWSVQALFDPTTGALTRTGDALWLTGLQLPAGAIVTRLEIEGCDFSGSADLEFQLYGTRVPPGTGFDLLTPQGGSTGTPGCGAFSVTPSSPPLIIDNAHTTYWISVRTFSGVLFDSVRVYYRRQVSPAPATATFGDVPTAHPFFQFVEALVASGITAGCGGGNYCPDAPLTRGQMAVFLAKSLGLHFAP
jgi:hypothetical protein